MERSSRNFQPSSSYGKCVPLTNVPCTVKNNFSLFSGYLPQNLLNSEPFPISLEGSSYRESTVVIFPCYTVSLGNGYVKYGTCHIFRLLNQDKNFLMYMSFKKSNKANNHSRVKEYKQFQTSTGSDGESMDCFFRGCITTKEKIISHSFCPQILLRKENEQSFFCEKELNTNIVLIQTWPASVQ